MSNRIRKESDLLEFIENIKGNRMAFDQFLQTMHGSSVLKIQQQLPYKTRNKSLNHTTTAITLDST